ncbi:hypothetical protein [Actinocorallia longicatena]|uniref:DUF1963 domain-containing protein n=1 Tax=Actinocorallia longicatena TaxID=111803 RepID=A0ABP6Q620_9ACTN
MIEELVARLESGDDDAADEIADLAAVDPEAVAPHLRRVLAANVLWRAPVLYRGGDADFQRYAAHRVETEPDAAARLVYALTQTRGPQVEETFRRWSHSLPEGVDPYGRGLRALARDGGWQPDGDGVRLLDGTTAYRLVPSGEATPAQEACPWCLSPLWTALDVDTADPAVARALDHTGWRGRLRVTTCHFCSCYGTTFSDVTPEGGAAWSERTVRPAFLRDAGPETPPSTGFEIGERRESPLLASAWEEGGSTLGGSPEWIQSPDYVVCPACDQAMDYVGLIGGADLDAYGEGAHYLFLHTPCALTAVVYQQS